eukprot:TRINITY_DN10836_c0_g2_i1.p1 TRINITY_DN10836_c0_g2~~TRINITY_DN10836_c0_g2_i1.p1  ORF type:complete len:1051 (+),score=413.49 TRINITY_DN10836_c0_g2_i1:160-3312(+)
MSATERSGSPGQSVPRDRTSLPHHRVREMQENQKRVQRQKMEKRFIADISSDRHKGKLSDYKFLQDQVSTTGHITFDSKRPVLDSTRKAIQDRHERELRSRPKPGQYQPIRLLSEFSGSIRCLEASQGGATLWTGDHDGTIAIRNGKTGDPVHHIPGSGGHVVDSLYATDTHMWVGMNNGTLRIYDHLVYILVSEATFHSDSISCFTTTFDNKVFSGGRDGDIIKWDTEANNFEVMGRWKTEVTIRSMACYGYNLFVGCEDGTVKCLDSESGAVQKKFEGHQEAVSALLVQDGFLFSGSSDGTVRAWDIESAECIFPLGTTSTPPVAHSAAVTGLVGDPVAHRFWSSDAVGVIHVWESVPESDFKHLYAIRDHEQSGRPIVNMCALPCSDAIKMWSVTSMGENRCWHSAVNKAEDAAYATVEAMESIIHQDLVELAKWKDLVKKLEGIDAERKRKLAEVLSTGSDGFTLRWRYMQLYKHRAYVRRMRRYQRVAEIAARSSDSALRFAAWHRLAAYLHRGKTQRRKQAVANMLLTQTHQGLQLIYWRKIRAQALVARKRARQQRGAECLLSGTEAGLRRIAWRKWRKNLDAASRRRKRLLAAESLLLCTDRGRMRVFYLHLKAYKKFNARRKKRQELLDTLMRNTDSGMRRVYYFKLMHFAKYQALRRQRAYRAECMEGHRGKYLRERYYGLLASYRRWKHLEAKKGELGDEQQRKAMLKKDYDEKSTLLARLKTVEAKRQELQEYRDRLEDARRARMEKEQELERVQQSIQEEQQGRKAREEEMKDSLRVEDFMARLKARVLNYHNDYTLIEKTRDQVHPIGHLPVEKLFLESHMAIKRVVIEVTKHQIATGERWEALRKGTKWREIPEHHKMTILHAIKVMIICYDLMPQTIRDQLQTDDEILNNTEYLEFLARVGKAEEDKRRGVTADGSPRRSRSRRGSSKSKGGASKSRGQSEGSPSRKASAGERQSPSRKSGSAKSPSRKSGSAGGAQSPSRKSGSAAGAQSPARGGSSPSRQSPRRQSKSGGSGSPSRRSGSRKSRQDGQAGDA